MINDRRWKIFHVIRLWEGISFFFPSLCRKIDSNRFPWISMNIDRWNGMIVGRFSYGNRSVFGILVN